MLSILQDNLLMLSPILFLSVVGFSIIIERFFYYVTTKSNENLIRKAGSLFANGKTEHALDLLANTKDNSAEKAILRYASENRYMVEDMLRNRLEIIANNRINLMEKNVIYLSSIANIATLLGLLGTVLGMIVAFTAIAEASASDPFIISGGIGQAMITTAAGLIVSIPNLFFYHIYAEIIARRASRLETLIAEVITTKGSRT